MNRNQANRGKIAAVPRGKVQVRGKQPAFAANNHGPFGNITMLGALSAVNSLIEDYSSMQGPMRNDTPKEILSKLNKSLTNNDFSTIESYCKFHHSLIPTLINTSQSYSILHRACKLSRVQAVEYFLTYGGNPNLKNESNSTPMHKAYNSSAIVELLIRHGSDINSQNKSGSTPLHKAIKKKSWDVAKLMIKLGGSLRLQDNSGKFPVDYCEDKEILRQLESLFVWSKAKNAIFVYKFSFYSKIKENVFREVLKYL